MQIKATRTKMHKTTVANNSDLGWSPREIPVAEAKLVLVDAYLDGENLFNISIDGKLKLPIAISETEKIEEGDWIFGCDTSLVTVGLGKASKTWKEDMDYIGAKVFKVLALPEHFSPKHLQAIVDGKMKDGDKVLVELEFLDRLVTADIDPKGRLYGYHIKLNSQNHITLHKIEEKIISVQVLEKAYNDGYANGANRKSIDFEVWFEQNVK